MQTQSATTNGHSDAMRLELTQRLDLLTIEQISAILQVVRTMEPTANSENHVNINGATYDEAADPAIGLFVGPPGLATQAKDILHAEIDTASGWTQKQS